MVGSPKNMTKIFMETFSLEFVVKRVGCSILSLLALSATDLVAEGESEFEKRRQQVLEKYDANQDGRLDAEEREAVRQGRKEGLNKPSSRRRSRREEEKHPPELLALYDKDKSGWIDGDEWDVAGPAESAKILKQFDTDEDGALGEKEKETLWGAIRSEKLKGVYAGIAHYFFLREEEGEPSYVTRQKALLKYDADGDGLASREELLAIRAARMAKKERPE